MPLYELRLVQLLQVPLLVGRQHAARGPEGVLDAIHRVEPDDGRRHPTAEPGQAHMAHRPAALPGHLLDPAHDGRRAVALTVEGTVAAPR